MRCILSLLVLVAACGADPIDTDGCTERTSTTRGLTPTLFVVLEIDPPRIDFGSVPVGDRSEALVAYLRNVGTAVARTSSTGPSTNAFAASLNEIAIPPNGSAAVRVDFRPGAPGAFEDQITFDAPDPCEVAVTLELRGTGVP